MNCFLHGVARAVFETFDLPTPILEVGSYQVAGQETIGNLRPYFPATEYTGLDLRPGPGVDRVGSVEQLPFATGSIGTVIAMSTFEHVKQFWRGFDEVHRVLRPNGAFLVSCPFHFHIHSHPSDYWRFTPEALKVLLERYPNKLIGQHGPPRRPANVWALAFREAHPGITEVQRGQYLARINEYAREPIAPLRKLRYWIGRLVCGQRPFAPWLQREKWHVEFIVGRTETVNCARSLPQAKGEASPVGLYRQLELSRGASSVSAVTDP
jgi:SAM-dependent methyltransferase